MHHNFINEIGDLIKREGSRSYLNPTAGCSNLYQASLCGITATFSHMGLVRIHAHDLDVSLVPAIVFTKGSDWVVSLWHKHLMAYSRSIRTTLSPRDIAA